MRVYQLIRVSGGRPTATSGHRTAHRKLWDDLERIMRMVSSAIPIITFRYYPYKRKKLTFWVSLTALDFGGSSCSASGSLSEIFTIGGVDDST